MTHNTVRILLLSLAVAATPAWAHQPTTKAKAKTASSSKKKTHTHTTKTGHTSTAPIVESTRSTWTATASAPVAVAAAPVVAAVATTPLYNWTGAYAGANLGVLWQGAHLTAHHANFINETGSYSQDINPNAINPGFQFGYLHHFEADEWNNHDPNWVAGVEADFTYPATNSKYKMTSACCSDDLFRVRNNLQGSLRLRSGYAFDRWLPYISAGVSFASMGLYYTNDIGDAYSKSTAQTGWVLGGGMEYGFLDNLTGRLEYLYTDYGNALNMNMPTLGGVTDPNGSAHSTMSTNVLRAAVNFRF
jgi:outer membrane immunogenic protein